MFIKKKENTRCANFVWRRDEKLAALVLLRSGVEDRIEKVLVREEVMKKKKDGKKI